MLHLCVILKQKKNFLLILFIYLFLAVLGLHYCTDFSLVVATRGYSLVCSPWTSHCRGFSCGVRAPDGQVSVVVAHGLWSMAYGIFPEQGLNPCLLHWQADSSPLSHTGSPLESESVGHSVVSDSLQPHGL